MGLAWVQHQDSMSHSLFQDTAMTLQALSEYSIKTQCLIHCSRTQQWLYRPCLRTASRPNVCFVAPGHSSGSTGLAWVQHQDSMSHSLFQDTAMTLQALSEYSIKTQCLIHCSRTQHWFYRPCLSTASRPNVCFVAPGHSSGSTGLAWVQHQDSMSHSLFQDTAVALHALAEYSIRLVNKCMSTHLNANVSLDSNGNMNTNAIFQEYIQMQMFWLHICKCI